MSWLTVMGDRPQIMTSKCGVKPHLIWVLEKTKILREALAIGQGNLDGQKHGISV